VDEELRDLALLFKEELARQLYRHGDWFSQQLSKLPENPTQATGNQILRIFTLLSGELTLKQSALDEHFMQPCLQVLG
jgi:hypothetical protein